MQENLLFTLLIIYSCFQTSLQVPSPGNGVIEELLVEDGATVKAGQPLFKIRLTGKTMAYGNRPQERSVRLHL